MATAKVKQGDFVEIDFVGRIKSTNQIFDLTIEDVAHKEGVPHAHDKLAPMVVVIGANHTILGLDNALIGKSVGDEFEIDILPEAAFGVRDPKKIQLMTLNSLRKKDINPVPGLQLDVGGKIATVRSVTGGRVIIDFNHPLAGKELHYWIRINRKLLMLSDKAKALVNLLTGQEATTTVKGKDISVKFKQKLPEGLPKLLEAQIKNQLSDAGKVTIS